MIMHDWTAAEKDPCRVLQEQEQLDTRDHQADGVIVAVVPRNAPADLRPCVLFRFSACFRVLSRF